MFSICENLLNHSSNGVIQKVLNDFPEASYIYVKLSYGYICQTLSSIQLDINVNEP
jgi:hypothetical protein